MIIISVPNIKDLKASSLTKYDLPDPDLANITELAFSKVNLSKRIKESLCSLMPYMIPSLAVSSDEAKGKVVAKEVVSMLWVRLRKSCPWGRQDLKPSSICKVVCLAVIEREAKVDSTSFEVLCNSSKDKAGTLM